jgi:hypothetical protein
MGQSHLNIHTWYIDSVGAEGKNLPAKMQILRSPAGLKAVLARLIPFLRRIR